MHSGQHELSHPSLEVTIGSLRRYFATQGDTAPLRNPHVEPRVSEAVVNKATPSAVLLPILDLPEPRLLVTRRHHGIRFAGHVCFPGGKIDPTDINPVAAALREAEEEIGLASASVEVLGSLGDYFTQTGFRITPVVALVDPLAPLKINPHEVASIHDITFRRLFVSKSYSLSWHSQDRGHFSFTEDGVRIAGPTVSIMIGFYESLLKAAAR